ncbi:hypothetical protein AB6B38_13365 [Glycocaulis abyssi]|uniref:IcmF-related N-terminal domain-containing protein n=1 Tax=Glycocaulis abyssi TaxID=1433403 RepID=A0ABV9NE03_9PROT
MDVFSRRFQYRIGSGLYDDQLQLHDYDAVERFLNQRRGEISSVKANEHVTRELVLRHQVRVAVTQSLGGRGAGTLPDGPRLVLADLYEQVANPLAGVIRRPSLDWLMPPTTPDASQSIQPPDGEPIGADRFAMWSCVLLMDYVETHYAALADSVKTEFARDLNSRLANGRSPWMLVMGRWRRETWPADRDNPFDAVLHSLWSETDEALRRQLNARLGENYVVGEESTALAPLPPGAEARREEIREKLKKAAAKLATADRLLVTDPALTEAGYRKAVDVARAAFDICAEAFRGSILGPFVKYRSGRRPVAGRARTAEGTAPSHSVTHTRELSPEAAAWRLRKLSEYMISGHDLPRALPGAADRKAMLERAPLAEFLARLVLMGPSESEAEEYARIVGAPRGAKYELLVEDEVVARMVVDLMARLGVYAAGADKPDLRTESSGGRFAGFVDFRVREAQRAEMMRRISQWAVRILILGGAMALSFYAGIMAAQRGLLG